MGLGAASEGFNLDNQWLLHKGSSPEENNALCVNSQRWNENLFFPTSLTYFNQARKKSTKINFLGPETARWGGGLPREGVVAEKFVLSLESLSSLGFGERNLGCPENFAGMSQTPWGVQKLCAEKVRVHFSFPIQAPLNGGVSNGGVSRSGLVLPFLSFLGLSRFFWDLPDLLRDGPGIFPISPFPLSRPIKSTYEEQSRKGPRHNLDLSQKKVGNTRVWKPPGLASLKYYDLSGYVTL